MNKNRNEGILFTLSVERETSYMYMYRYEYYDFIDFLRTFFLRRIVHNIILQKVQFIMQQKIYLYIYKCFIQFRSAEFK